MLRALDKVFSGHVKIRDTENPENTELHHVHTRFSSGLKRFSLVWELD